MSGKLSGFILSMFGFKIVGEVPVHLNKYVIAVVPHTSNWDFPLGLLVRAYMRQDIKFIGKHTLFKPPFGWIFRWLGGYPVDRSKSSNYVDGVVDVIQKEEKFALCLAPEGTRKKVDRLKTGFYFIAKKAGIPLILVRFDFGTKTISISDPYYTTDDMEKDFEFIYEYFKGAVGLNPGKSFVAPKK